MSTREQLDAVRNDLRAAQNSAQQLAAAVGDDAWRTRPADGGWSAAECIAHLTLTTNAYLPLLNEACARVPAGAQPPANYGRGFAAMLLEWYLNPPSRVRSKTLPPFVPGSAESKADVMREFAKSQDALLAWIDSASGIALDRAMIASPFNEKMKYNAYAALRILAAHQRRHIWQAGRATRGGR